MPKAFWLFAILGGVLWNGMCDTVFILTWENLWLPMGVIAFVMWCALMGTTAAAWPPKPQPPQDAQAKPEPPRPGNV